MTSTTELTDFDVADYLTDAETIAEYLRLAFADPDPHSFPDALGQIARARGMARVADQTGLSRHILDKALTRDGNPTWEMVHKVLRAVAPGGLVIPPAGE